MSIENGLRERSSGSCELCLSSEELAPYDVAPNAGPSVDHSVLLCSTCRQQIEGSNGLEATHWYCLKDSMWSEYPAVQVLAYRVLKRLADEVFARDLLAQLYLDDATKAWADADGSSAAETSVLAVDSNGTVLATGDSVTLIKDLVVKGANFTAKRGTMVKNIALTDDPKHVEGRVGGMRIVLVAAFLKKA